ncbi:MAG: hypothetical protein V3W19_00660 [Desulfatiglandales bacterium]
MEDEIHDREENREFFRVKYPVADRPKLKIAREEFDIVDISEKGIKFDLKKTIHATITFHDGESLTIEGRFLRTHNNEIVIQPLEAISSERITKEQRNLQKKYSGYR